MILAKLRPSNWNQIVGQARPLRLLHGALRNPHVMTRGFIFEGILGVGKTTAAYLFAKALMCNGTDPMGCGACDSCVTFRDVHPDFVEVDAADHSGVVATRKLLDMAQAPPIIGKRRVILIDESHNLSPEAWDVFLKPLEKMDTNTVFLFVSNESGSTPEDVASRCTTVPFMTISREDIIGLIANTAGKQGLNFELDAARFIAELAKGRARNALTMLFTVASVGPVTLDQCRALLNNDAEDYSYRIFAQMLSDNLTRSLELVTELSERIGTKGAIDALFTFFAKEAFSGKSVMVSRFPSVSAVTHIFLRWSIPNHLPSDVLALILIELSGQTTKTVSAPKLVLPVPPATKEVTLPPPSNTLPPIDFFAQVNGTKGN